LASWWISFLFTSQAEVGLKNSGRHQIVDQADQRQIMTFKGDVKEEAGQNKNFRHCRSPGEGSKEL
jgi:hypothetical protein